MNIQSRIYASSKSQNINPGHDEQLFIDLLFENQQKTKKPPRYKVLMLNDDYTPMDFVVHILQQLFDKPTEEAIKIMMNVHNNGIGVCGVYTYEIAETKVAQVINIARQQQHPLQCMLERE